MNGRQGQILIVHLFRNQCEELRAILNKRHHDDVCSERAEQLRIKHEAKLKEEEGEKGNSSTHVNNIHMHSIDTEEQMYARLWEEDQAAKCRREEIEAAMQIERNEEMLKVLTLQTAAIEKQKEEMRELKEKEAKLLV